VSKSIPDGGPAFPQHSVPAYQQRPELWGMSLRDYFAAAALPGAIQSAEKSIDSSPALAAAAQTEFGRNRVLGRIAVMAYSMADAMLTARGEKSGDLRAAVPADAACIYRDGNAWCAVNLDFINLQESPVGFGPTIEEAFAALRQQPQPAGA